MHLAGATKMELFPYSTQVFYVRLENLADDKFDTKYEYYERHEDDEDFDIPWEDYDWDGDWDDEWDDEDFDWDDQ